MAKRWAMPRYGVGVWLIWVTVTSSLLALAFFLTPSDPMVTVMALRLPAGQVFLAEDPRWPELQKFIQEERVEQVVHPYTGDFKRVLVLAQWTAKLFPASSPFPNYPPWNARTILRQIRAGQTGGYCAQYALVFGQACQALGYAVRYVDLAAPENMRGHFMAAVFIPSLREWIPFDASRGIYFGDGEGHPLNNLDLHRAAVGTDHRKIFEFPGRHPASRETLDLFYYFRYYLRNNFLSVPVFVDREGSNLLFEPYRLFWDDSFIRSSFRYQASRAIPSSNPLDFDFPLDLMHYVDLKCFRLADIQTALREAPPFTLYRLHLRQRLLTHYVQQLIDRPEFHQLAT